MSLQLNWALDNGAATAHTTSATMRKGDNKKTTKMERIKKRRRERWSTMMRFGRERRPVSDKTEHAADAGANGSSGESRPAARVAEAPEKSSAAPKEVISSLFSYNPSVPNLPTSVKTAGPSSAIVAPTNAATGESPFTSIGIDADVAMHLEARMSITTPTRIQSKAIPELLQTDRDVLIQSQTGSGKTMTYVLPILSRLMRFGDAVPALASRSTGTLAIILTPTRELAHQVEENITSVLRFKSRTHKHWIVSGHITGGDKRRAEKARLRSGVTVLVATPGRLLDHLRNSASFNVERLRWLVLDEADRLMDLGFADTLCEIMQLIRERTSEFPEAHGTLPERRQVWLCSATVDGKVKQLVGESLVDPLLITAARESGDEEYGDNVGAEETFEIPSQLRQRCIVTPSKLRLVTLLALLRSCVATAKDTAPVKVVVFLSCCDSVDFYFHLLTRVKANSERADGNGDSYGDDANSSDEEDARAMKHTRSKVDLDNDAVIAPSAIVHTTRRPMMHRLHGSLPQPLRIKVHASFRANPTSGNASILVCTDVAARGLDLPGVTHIIQYDPPTDAKDYIHRVGRTARIGNVGEAWLFLTPNEVTYIKRLQAVGVGSKKASSMQTEAYEDTLKRALGADAWEASATETQLTLERSVIADDHLRSLARNAYVSHIRSYATHCAAEKDIFHVKHLHLGHVAKAFALREMPSAVAKQDKKRRVKDETKKTREAGVKGEVLQARMKPHAGQPAKRFLSEVSEFAVPDASALASMEKRRKR